MLLKDLNATFKNKKRELAFSSLIVFNICQSIVFLIGRERKKNDD